MANASTDDTYEKAEKIMLKHLRALKDMESNLRDGDLDSAMHHVKRAAGSLQEIADVIEAAASEQHHD